MIAACETPPSTVLDDSSYRHAEALFRTAPCCAVPENMIRSPLQAEWDFLLSESGSLLMSSVGKGYYKAVELPEDRKTYYFQIDSFATGEGTDKQMAVPIVLVLNDDFSVSRASHPDMLDYRAPSRFWRVRESYQLFVRVDRASRPRERYVVLTTAEKLIGRRFKFRARSGPDTVVEAAFVSSPDGQIRMEYLNAPWKWPAAQFIRF